MKNILYTSWMSRKETRQQKFRFLKVQWSNRTEDETTWEKEDDLNENYPYIFE